MTKITRQPVKSSQLVSVGHEPTENLMDVEFHPRKGEKTGAVYRYSNFTADDFKAFMEAESQGSHFLKQIKTQPNKHPFVKLPEAAQ